MAALIWWEQRRALRSQKDSRLRRDTRNFVIAGIAGATMQALELPVALYIARRAQTRRYGLLQRIRAPASARKIAAVLLLDYTLYWWHVLAHRVPLLWRFHAAHHLDREMDATTGLRFHFGEIALSVVFRAAQVFIIGVTPGDLIVWQSFLFACILFHHANGRLPLCWERRIARFVVTPRLHGIHHSVAPDEVNSNWSSGLTVWDWCHGTLRTDVVQDNIVIGIEGRRDDVEMRFLNVLALPFRNPPAIPPMPDELPRQSTNSLK